MRRGRALSLFLCVALAACTRAPPATLALEDPWVDAPGAEDQGARCVDVHLARACFREGARTVKVARPTPAGLDTWRCKGAGAERACERRTGSTPGFTCKEERCEQPHPRMPDDGEWECFERAGAIVCRGGEPAAGVIASRRDQAWLCGDPPDVADAGQTRRRLCIDLAPDRPADAAYGACMIEHKSHGARQVCVKRAEPALGAACAADLDCPLGAVCEGAACLPARAPGLECWLDTDCGTGEACTFATCVKRP